MRLPQASLTMRQMTPVSSGEIQAVRSPRMRFTLRRMMASVMIVGLVLSIPFSEIFRSTDYAPGYSEEKFQSIRCGMSYSQVISLMGNPLVYDDRNSSIYLHYTYPANGGDYDLRWVQLDRSGVVIGVESFWYLD
jgi:hypothetical protein